LIKQVEALERIIHTKAEEYGELRKRFDRLRNVRASLEYASFF
jgi:hypothetical protein